MNIAKFGRGYFVYRYLIQMYKPLSNKARKSCTLDNGPEFTGHETVSEKTGLSIYFATPYHSWERGSNENANGLIRWYLPKKTDFDQISDEQIQLLSENCT